MYQEPYSSKRAVKIYLSRPGQFMDLSGRMGYKIFPGDVIQGGSSKERNMA